jgi:ferritin-like metal-binding protein YciE
MGMEGLVKEGAETMQEKYSDAVMDAALTCSDVWRKCSSNPWRS